MFCFIGTWSQRQRDLRCFETRETWGRLRAQLWDVCQVRCKCVMCAQRVYLSSRSISTSRSTGRMRTQSTHSSRTAVHRSGRSSKPRTNCIMIPIIRMTSGMTIFKIQLWSWLSSLIQMEFWKVPPGSQWPASAEIWRVSGSLRDHSWHWLSAWQHPPQWWR